MNLVRSRGDKPFGCRSRCVEVLETDRKIQSIEKPFNHDSKAADFVENRPLRSQNAQPVQAAFAAFFVGNQS